MEIISNNKTATNTVEVEFKASAEEFEQAVQAAYLKKKKNINVPGFRKLSLIHISEPTRP